jgi:hypothetical protein
MKTHGITKQYTIWCDACGNWDQASADTIRAFVKFMKRSGWYYTKTKVLCPACRGTQPASK